MTEKNYMKITTCKSVCAANYKGDWQIQTENNGKEGVVYTAWCVPAYWKNGELKLVLKKDGSFQFVPLAIPLGTYKEKALKVVGTLYHSLKKL